jgi:asparaginyl-tRNA synthetase
LGTKPIHDTINPPFPRISYRDAVSLLTGLGYPITFGTSLGSEEEAVLSKNYSTPFWIVGIPRKIEPFPYVIDPDDHEVTMTADLIASGGYGELLGVAEKISDPVMLMERMKEKGKWDNPNYEWLKDLRDFGCVPHIGFGMGVERYMRWVLGATHVRDMIPFPRIFGRQIYP